MPLIKPVNLETVAVRAKLPKSLDAEIEQYIQWAGVADKEFFLVEAARYLLKMDRDWKTYKDAKGDYSPQSVP